MGWIGGLALGALLAAVPALAEPVSIPYRTGIELDGALTEWAEEPTLVLRPGLDGDGRESAGGPFTEGDLEVEVWLRWDRDGLYFAARWLDDELDLEWVPQAMARWTDPGGGARDRMYFSDNLALRLAVDDRYYGLWLAPRLAPPGPYQWDVRRRVPVTADTISVEVQAPEVFARGDEAGVTVEGVLAWREVGIRAKPGKDAELRLIATDSDCPGVSYEDKTRRCLEWHSWVGEVVFGKRQRR